MPRRNSKNTKPALCQDPDVSKASLRELTKYYASGYRDEVLDVYGLAAAATEEYLTPQDNDGDTGARTSFTLFDYFDEENRRYVEEQSSKPKLSSSEKSPQNDTEGDYVMVSAPSR